ncbi:DNA-binding NtrC family response regulator [Clostridium acetobutylicum]|uniref:Stage 0 sporulation protein A homolog n=1 Tax=Clostridium acetobutylicum (strain ATCC 824 / DSM 792 / JCM 1419 / IAM 19013 / LMG 5710 / NBRC 13948 / NRRL B-527 / VKM B-1787 / 2291 / W) TaxID=272562 RepID=Q97GG0_CLOAB|nr:MULTISPECIES: response regulator [Clostridium]AAK80362.1 CheY-like receiver domain of response regulator [Clostridium acetobutylicum ATCC 824]ADZ21459.1 CheY-like receiver domain of response regulator [Clostridium acetobutylicum EA 2018]AEI33462.1 CheY-like domain-containing protein [Clostridium acetobutylicum DSM 1731]AWV79218.1 response regulator [Clostridium acetobutylicum]KHD38535.1 chemotaxis protein CheY [Clostridium acetobutylicum]
MYKNSILFVDDVKFILKTLDGILKGEKFNKFYASSAKEALEILENNDIDVIVTDILMPGINGLQLLQIVKNKYPKIVRVALSGNYNSSFIIEAINKGEVYRYLTKPITVGENYKKIIEETIEYSEYLKSAR